MNRRDFMKTMGLAGAAGLAGCSRDPEEANETKTDKETTETEKKERTPTDTEENTYEETGESEGAANEPEGELIGSTTQKGSPHIYMDINTGNGYKLNAGRTKEQKRGEDEDKIPRLTCESEIAFELTDNDGNLLDEKTMSEPDWSVLLEEAEDDQAGDYEIEAYVERINCEDVPDSYAETEFLVEVYEK